MVDNFTPAQKNELDKRAEKRDRDKSRVSTFSEGERIELDARDEVRGLTSFSPEQLLELNTIAEERDLSRRRMSRFSVGEQRELDDTAQDLRDEGVALAQALEAGVVTTAQDLRNENRAIANRLEAGVITTAESLKNERVKRAEDLEFNTRQNADLAHRFNMVNRADQSFQFRRRFLPFIVSGLLIAVGLVDYIAQTNHQQSNQAAIVVFCQQHHLGNCKP